MALPLAIEKAVWLVGSLYSTGSAQTLLDTIWGLPGPPSIQVCSFRLSYFLSYFPLDFGLRFWRC